MFLDCGYSPLLFEQLSPAQIADLLNSYSRRQQQKQQEYLQQVRDNMTILDGALYVLLHNLAGMMPGSSGTEYLRLQDIFPEIYADENTEAKKQDGADSGQKKLSPAMQLYKAQRLDHAYRFNAQRAKKAQKEEG